MKKAINYKKEKTKMMIEQDALNSLVSSFANYENIPEIYY